MNYQPAIQSAHTEKLHRAKQRSLGMMLLLKRVEGSRCSKLSIEETDEAHVTETALWSKPKRCIESVACLFLSR